MGELTVPEQYLGFLALSLAHQADIDTEEAVGISFPTLLGFSMERSAAADEDFADRVSGFYGLIEHDITRWTVEGTYEMFASPEIVAFIASMVFGSVVTTGVGPDHVHTFSPLKTSTVKKTRTMVYDDGNEASKFIGMTASGFTLSWDKSKDHIDFSAELVGRGSQVAGAFSEPTKASQDFLKLGDIVVETNGTWNGTAWSGGTSINDSLQSFEVTMDDGRGGGAQEGDYQPGATQDDGASLAGQLQRLNWNYGITFTRVWEDDALRTEFETGAWFGVYIKFTGGILGGSNFMIEMIFPRCIIREFAKPIDDGRVGVETVIQPLEHTTGPYDPFILIITEDHATII